MTEGILLIDKPSTWTSHDVIGKLRRLFGMKRVGHAGTLDPMATGLLIVGFGRATRLLRFLQELPKVYEADVLFGIATDSGDADGTTIADAPVAFTVDELSSAASQFEGVIQQVPPLVSAVKRGGERLHRLARKGVTVEVDARPVEVHELTITAADLPRATLRVRCGKGMYVRVLADDLAISLGSRAHLTALRRLASGSLSIDQATTLDQLEEAEDRHGFLLTPAEAMCDFPTVSVPHDQVHAARHGAPIDVAGPQGLVTAHDAGELIGVYMSDGRRLVPEVVVA